MKYALAAAAVLAAIAALVFRPPQPGAPAAPPRVEGATARSAGPAAPERRAAPTIVVYVAGEVVRPGLYRLAPGARADDAVRRAGGPKADADVVAVNLAAPLEDGTEVAVPARGAIPPRRSGRSGPRARRADSTPGSHRRRRHRSPRVTAAAATDAPGVTAAAPLDLNTADADALEGLPGIGPTLAARIVAYRELNGPFASVDELVDIAGITPRLEQRLADLVVVHAPTP